MADNSLPPEELPPMTDQITFYYDYLCPFSYRTYRWLREVQQAGCALELTFRAFLLKEVNRPPEHPSYFAPDGPDTFSLLALELAKAAQASDPAIFSRYHDLLYDALHRDGRRLTSDEALALAATAGLDVAQFQEERASGRWRQAVAEDYQEARQRWQIFGVPTTVWNDTVSVYLKLRQQPTGTTRAVEAYEALRSLLRQAPELIEVKYSLA